MIALLLDVKMNQKKSKKRGIALSVLAWWIIGLLLLLIVILIIFILRGKGVSMFEYLKDLIRFKGK